MSHKMYYCNIICDGLHYIFSVIPLISGMYNQTLLIPGLFQLCSTDALTVKVVSLQTVFPAMLTQMHQLFLDSLYLTVLLIIQMHAGLSFVPDLKGHIGFITSWLVNISKISTVSVFTTRNQRPLFSFLRGNLQVIIHTLIDTVWCSCRLSDAGCWVEIGKSKNL